MAISPGLEAAPLERQRYRRLRARYSSQQRAAMHDSLRDGHIAVDECDLYVRSVLCGTRALHVDVAILEQALAIESDRICSQVALKKQQAVPVFLLRRL